MRCFELMAVPKAMRAGSLIFGVLNVEHRTPNIEHRNGNHLAGAGPIIGVKVAGRLFRRPATNPSGSLGGN